MRLAVDELEPVTRRVAEARADVPLLTLLRDELRLSLDEVVSFEALLELSVDWVLAVPLLEPLRSVVSFRESLCSELSL